ncbi:zinc ABC transporter substrate-binding protein [Shouchella sp. 1P09AA]|uniref:metal ABC transporter solute-binding protein, Zn/Mn family n=1 Tax=unclassified Shouchella TaxID=2893065 RepID=UPI0039A39BE8
MKKTILLTVGLSATAMLAACGDDQGTDDNTEQLFIKTSIFPYQDWTTAIGGDYVDVENIVPAGADAHTYEPTPQEMIEVADADLFIYNGAELEPFADSILSAIENQDVHILEGSAQTHLIASDHDHDHGDEHDHSPLINEGDLQVNGIQDHYHSDDSATLSVDDEGDWHWYTSTDNENWDRVTEEPTNEYSFTTNHNGLHVQAVQYDENEEVIATSDTVQIIIDDHDEHDHNHGDYDPHVWLDPIRSIEIAQSIRDTLTELMPEQEDYFNENFQALEAQFHELDEAFVDTVETATHDTFIVSHAGYGYWEQRYGLNQIGIAGISPTSEPSQTELIQTVEKAQELGLHYVLFEPNITPRVSEIVQDHLDAEALQIHPLESLTEEDKENDEDYFSLMRSNVETLEQALNE